MSAASTVDTWFVLNVVGQVTVVCAAALLVSLAFRCNAAARKWVLSCGLVCVAACPIFALLVNATGLGYRIDPTSWMTASDQDLRGMAAPEPLTASAPAPLTEAGDLPAQAGAAIKYEPFRTDAGPAMPKVNWISLSLLGAWSLVTFALLLGIARSYWRLRRIVADSTPAQEPAVNRLWGELTRTFHGDAAPGVRVSDAIRTPIAAGPWRPMVILPRGIIERVNDNELKAILLHELAHVRSRDPMVLLLQQIVAAVYWPHPFIHVQNRWLARAREDVCDNCVLAEIQPKEYGEVLLRISRMVSLPEIRSSLVGFLPFTRNLESRIRGLLNTRRTIVTKIGHGLSVALAAAMLAVTALVTSIAVAQEDASNRNPQSESGEQNPRAEMRTWTDRTGKYTTNARIVGFEKDTVRLRKDDGKLVSVPLARLSAADQEYVRARIEEDPSASSQPGPIEVEYTPVPNEAERKIYAALNQPASLAFENLGLAEFVTTLQSEFGIPIELHLEATFDLSQVSLSADGQELQLDLALTRVFDGTDLGYMVINGALVILPSSEVEQRQIERTYAVEDITKSASELRDLMVALTTTCGPEAWSYNGGPAEISPVERPRRLVVLQSFDAHQYIVRFLRACKELQAGAARDDAVGELVDSLESQDKATRAAAYYMLARLGPKARPAVPSLIRALASQFDRRTHFDKLAAYALAQIGQAAVPELTKAASSDDESLAREAQRVLDRIRGTPGLGGGLSDASGGGFF